MLEIKFENLFGRFDYDVKLNKEGLTILTGPNGFGKSTILKSIEAIGKGLNGIMYFFSFDFKKITVLFKGDKKITIEKSNKNLDINGNKISYEDLKKFSVEYLDRNRPFMSRLDEDTWIDRRKGIKFSLDEYFEDIIRYDSEDIIRYDSINKVRKSKSRFILHDVLKTLDDAKKMLGNVYFIREQRLIRKSRNYRDENEIINIIEELPDNFKELIRKVQQDYVDTSSQLDSTYPNRLFNNEEVITKVEFEQKMQEMTEKFVMLNKYGLSVKEHYGNFVFKEEHAKALKIYFDDFNEKYSVYEDFIYKLELYTEIINHRLSFKKIEISKTKGIDVLDENNNNLKLNQLSSGEKQEIVLFYELIFGTQKNVLLLIDEPEISLHITWQKKFMDDLLKIIKYKGINVIVATHSPQIINNHWERQIDLGELYGNQFDKK